MNLWIVIGRVGHDPEIRYTAQGSKLARFQIATNRQWTDKAGDKHEKTEWNRIVAWTAIAESVDKVVKKGDLVAVSGYAETRSFEDKDGVSKATTELIAGYVHKLTGVYSGDDKLREALDRIEELEALLEEMENAARG